VNQVIVTIDIETTGLDLVMDDPLQIAAVGHLYNGESTTPQILMNSLCNPNAPIQDEALAIHKIGYDMVRFAPRPKAAVKTLEMVIRQAGVDGNVILCSYNGEQFDIPMLSRTGGSIHTYLHIDVYDLVLRHLAKKGHGRKLEEVYPSYVGGDASNSHDAAADCLMTAEILIKYCHESGKSPAEIVEELQVPTPYETFPWGKHEGKPLNKVPKGYVKWCQENFDSVSRDLDATFKAILGDG